MTFTAGGGADGTAPVLVSTSPAGGTLGVAVNPIVRLQFNEPMDVVALGSAITVTGGGSPAAGSLSFSGDHTQLIFTPAGFLAPRTGDTVSANGLKDVAGDLAGAPDFRFTTRSSGGGPTTPPSAVANTPGPGADQMAGRHRPARAF